MKRLKEAFYPEDIDSQFESDLDLDYIEFERINPYTYRILSKNRLKDALKVAKEHNYSDSWLEMGARELHLAESVKKPKIDCIKYKGYIICKDRAGDGWNIYTSDGDIEDEGYIDIFDAKKSIDKWNKGINESYEFIDSKPRGMTLEKEVGTNHYIVLVTGRPLGEIYADSDKEAKKKFQNALWSFIPKKKDISYQGPGEYHFYYMKDDDDEGWDRGWDEPRSMYKCTVYDEDDFNSEVNDNQYLQDGIIYLVRTEKVSNTNESLSTYIREALNLNLYDDGYVEVCDGEPTFIYSTYQDARRGVFNSRYGDVIYGMGQHDYEIMLWKDGQLLPLPKNLDESYLTEYYGRYWPEPDYDLTIKTGFGDKAAIDVLNSIRGQLSDGIWENSPAMEKYWRYFTVNNGDILVDTQNYASGFHKKSEDQIRKWLAGKVKQIVKTEMEDWGDVGTWDRGNDTQLRYMGYGNDAPTVKDAYRVYDKLMGRKDRIKEDLENDNIWNPYINQLVDIIKGYGYTLDNSVTPIQDNFGGGKHLQIINPRKVSISSEDDLFEAVRPVVIALDDFEEEFIDPKTLGFMTFNFGVNKDGCITAGIDFHPHPSKRKY